MDGLDGEKKFILLRYAVDATRRPVAARHLTEGQSDGRCRSSRHTGESGGDTT